MPAERKQQRQVIVQGSDELRAELAATEQRLRQLQALKVDRWLYNPVLWVQECLEWDDGEGLTDYQKEILDDLVQHSRAAVRGPHGLGKTTTNALAVLWFSTTRELAGYGWKCITTAGAWRQLERYLWPEIHQWSRKIKWDVLGMRPFTGAQLLDLSIKLTHGFAAAVAASDATLIEGAHADSLLYIYDEAKSIAPTIFDASEGAFSGASTVKRELPEAFGLAQSTPGEPEGRFYDIHMRKAGFEEWHVRHVKLEDAIAAGRISRHWAEGRMRQWGQRSQLYANRVLGEFKSSDSNTTIPLTWIEAAVERWNEWKDDGGGLPPMSNLGLDVAREGDDETVLARRFGVIIGELQHESFDDTTTTAGWGNAILRVNGDTTATVDVIGVGAGVFDMMRAEFGRRVIPFNAAESTDRTDASGQHEFLNKRAAGWWHMRDLLDPSRGATLCLPPDDLLIGDLAAPRWKMSKTGKVQIEAKEDIKKRLGRSPDSGDAVVLACWPEARRGRMTFAGRVSGSSAQGTLVTSVYR